MHILIKREHNTTRMIRNKNNRAHRRMHLETANDIRERAEKLRDDYTTRIVKAYNEGLVNDAMRDEGMKEIDTIYHEMLSEAIAEENSKCMDDRRHK